MKTKISLTAILLMIVSAGMAQNNVVTDDLAVNAPAADRSISIEAAIDQPAMLDFCMPNPVVSTCAVRYLVPDESTFSQLIIQNDHGNVVFASDPLVPGKGTLQLSVDEFPAGNYYYTLTVDYAKVETRHLIITH